MLARPQATAIFSSMRRWYTHLFVLDGGPMTYYGAKQLADSFRSVRKNTLAIAEDIPEDQYSFKATPEVMSVAEMLAHLAVTPSWQLHVYGNRIPRVEFALFTERRQQAQEAETQLKT